MSEEGHLKGTFFLMVHGLLVEYNPEIAEEVSKNLSFDVSALDPEGWYPLSNFLEYLKKLSPDAVLATGKLMVPSIVKRVPSLKESSGPIEMLEKLTVLSAQSYKDIEPDRWELLESGDDFLKMKCHTAFYDYPNVDEGIIRGILAQFKIVHVHVTVTKEADNSLLFEIKWE